MTIEEIDRKLAAGIRWSFVGLLFFLPLLVSTRSSEVFEFPKMVFVYAATAVIVGLWLMRMVARRKILIRRTPLDIPILLFLISQMVSTIYSIDPAVSWWGWYGRFHGGLWSTISYTLLYYALLSNRFTIYDLPARNAFSIADAGGRFMNKAILSSALLVSCYAILQHFGIDKDFWVQDVVNRVFSTQGQPNWLAAYLVMAIPLGWAMAIVKAKGQRPNNPWPLALILIFFLALLWTKSRSGLIGLAAADLVFWSVILFKRFNSSSRVRSKATNREIQRNDKNISIADARSLDSAPSGCSARDDAFHFLLIHLLLTILILATNNPIREALLRNGLARNDGAAMESGITLRKSEHGGTESGDIRRLVWSGAIQLIKQRPVFGFGPETFGETYWRVRPKEHNLTSEWNFLYNKAHNEWLNLAANTGLFGLGSHLLLLIWFSIWVLKGPALGYQGRALSSYAILAAIVGVEAVNFFGFSTVTVGTYQYLFMAMAVTTIRAKGQGPKAKGDTGTDTLGPWPLALILIFFLAVLYLLSQFFILFLADLAYNRGRAYQDSGYIEEAVEPLTQAVNLAPGEPVFRAELAESEGTFAATLLSQERSLLDVRQGDSLSETIAQLKDDSLANFEIVRRQSPQNLGFVRTQSRVLFNMRDIDPSLGTEAIQLMKLAMEMAPTNPQLPYSLAVMLEKMEKPEEAATYYNKAVELKPDYAGAINALHDG